ncbi:hypothetical protein [Cellulomonas sp. Root137]|uniref:TY-Chap2 family putative peptide chaperone n=1 Tax=Cellulomonas sp. Root137 TaxID=1736459 RepID=UPI0006F3ED4E|nr:hypothetical protein [Cellulomonas sp. Root137]KQY41856.1 hypothetical protein ASD18_19650 [Cellulomonas sp. Root137]
MTEPTADESELEQPSRAHTLAATWAIAARLVEHWDGLDLARPDDDPEVLLTIAASRGAHPFVAFHHVAGIAIRNGGEVENVEWFDVFAQPFPTTTADVILEALAPQAGRPGTPPDALAHQVVATYLASVVDDGGHWEVASDGDEGWVVRRDGEYVWSVYPPTGRIKRVGVRGAESLADALIRVGGDRTLLVLDLLGRL